MDTTRFRLAVSDIDGTLVISGSNTVSPLLHETIARLRKQGVFFTIATGRSWKETQPLVELLRIGIPVIVESGALIINPRDGAVLAKQPVRPGINIRMDETVLPAGIDCFRLAPDGEFYYEQVQSLCGHWLIEHRECRKVALDAGRQEWLKYLFVGKAEPLAVLAEELRARFGSLLNPILWPPEPNGESFLEVFDGAASKGQAIQKLARDLQIPPAEVVTFGDSYNDFDLITRAGCGVAIENAPGFLRQAADLVIPGPAEEGIARFFNGEFTLAEKKAI